MLEYEFYEIDKACYSGYGTDNTNWKANFLALLTIVSLKNDLDAITYAEQRYRDKIVAIQCSEGIIALCRNFKYNP